MRLSYLLGVISLVALGVNSPGAPDPPDHSTYTHYGYCQGEGPTRGLAYSEARARVPTGAIVYRKHFAGSDGKNGKGYWLYRLWWKRET